MKSIEEHLREKNQNPAHFRFKPNTMAKKVVFVGKVNTFPGQVANYEIERESLIDQADEIIVDSTNPDNQYAVFY